VTKAGGPAERVAWPSYYRVAILRAAGLTSDDLESHLMTLGEYLAMYLFVWSDVLWPGTLPTFDDVRAAVAERSVRRGEAHSARRGHRSRHQERQLAFTSALVMECLGAGDGIVGAQTG